MFVNQDHQRVALLLRFMVINARSLAKPDACSALYLELNSHNVDLGIVTETWLKSTIPSQVVCPDGFTVIRKDRPYGWQGGGVAVFCRHARLETRNFGRISESL